MQDWIKEMLRHQEENRELLKVIDKELRYAPKGVLRLSQYRGTTHYYRTRWAEGKGKEYLGEKKAALRDSLAQKAYNLELRDAVEQEQRLIESVLQQVPPTPLEVYAALPKEFQELVEPHILPDSVFVERWLEKMSAGASGEDFRSRIEIIYNDIYQKLNVPHVYEPSLYLEGYGPVRPDFVALNVRTRQVIYHEHLGMMDNDEYRARNIEKLRWYHRGGYYEGINLIVTMESDGRMVSYEEAEAIIRTYCT